MRLKVRKALTGEPNDGDIVDIVMTDGRTLTVVFDPHFTFDHYEWHVQSGQELEEAKPLFAELKKRGIDTQWVRCYLNCVREVVIGEPLYLVLVPRGNMLEWPQAVTQSSVADIKIR